MGRLHLPSGGWADFRDPTHLKERHRRPLKMLVVRINQAAAAAGYEVNPKTTLSELMAVLPPDLIESAESTVILALLEGWSYDATISADALLDEPEGGDYDAIRDEAQRLMPAAFVSFAASPDKDSPTGPSSASGQRSEGNAVSSSAPNGVSTASSVSG